jgi:hypothetical protein
VEERLQSRTSELLLEGAKTMLSVISQSVRDARAQLHTGHQDMRTYFSQATAATTAHPTATPRLAGPARSNVLLLDVRQRFQSARTRKATLPSDIRRSYWRNDYNYEPLISWHGPRLFSSKHPRCPGPIPYRSSKYLTYFYNMTATEPTTTATPTATTAAEHSTPSCPLSSAVHLPATKSTPT